MSEFVHVIGCIWINICLFLSLLWSLCSGRGRTCSRPAHLYAPAFVNPNLLDAPQAICFSQSSLACLIFWMDKVLCQYKDVSVRISSGWHKRVNNISQTQLKVVFDLIPLSIKTLDWQFRGLSFLGHDMMERYNLEDNVRMICKSCRMHILHVRTNCDWQQFQTKFMIWMNILSSKFKLTLFIVQGGIALPA